MSEPRSKYGNRKASEDGYTFDSLAEWRRYQQLKLITAAGEIGRLTVHPRYPLHSPVGQAIGHYEADFWYVDYRLGEQVIEDVKGVRTELYRWKRKHFEQEYAPRRITEIAAKDVGR